jgi:uncharacterized protein (UPF0548 family)
MAARARKADRGLCVYVVSETGRSGLAYGTLPRHPESGEEAFLLEQQDDGTVTFTVTAFSRPATALAPGGRTARARHPVAPH